MIVTKKQLLLLVSGGILALIILNSLPTRAGLVKFYPESCLGGWQNPQLASGEADKQAAVLSDSLSEIFCGGFKGEIPGDTEAKKFHLKLAWKIDDGSGVLAPEATTTLSGSDFSDQVVKALEVSDETPTELTITDATTTNATSTDISVPVDTAQEPGNQENPEKPENTTPPEIVPPTSPQGPTEAPEPVPESATPAPSEAPVSWWRYLIGEARASTTVQTAAEIIAEADKSAVISDSDWLEVFYTIDSTNWQSLGRVTKSNWQETNFELPLSGWDDLARLQISVRSLERLGKPLRVELDSLWLEVEYVNPFSDEFTPQELLLLPRVELPENQVFIPGEENFRAEESPAFLLNKNLNLPEATSTPELATTTDQIATTTPKLLPLELPAKFLNWLKPRLAITRALAETPGPARVIKTLVKDNQGKIVAFKPKVEIGQDNISVSLPKPDGPFRPGKYSLTVELLQNRQIIVSTTEFYWGVLALNANKSVYAPGERAYLQFAVLSNDGHTICDANLSLAISGPDNRQIFLSTENGEITRSETCGANNVTDDPDYFAHYIFSQAGRYDLLLTDTSNGHQIRDSILVRAGDSFTIERIGATRINPFKADYVMRLRVTAVNNFSGTLQESLPAEFGVTDPGSATLVAGDLRQALHWTFVLKPGETRELQYQYHAPPLSPQIYLLGPARLLEGGQAVFTEAREWQIAADNACQSNGTGGGNWNTAGTWTSCGGTVPQAADTVTIVNGDTVTLDVDSAITSITINNGGTLTTDNNSRILTLTPAAAGTAWTIGSTGTFTPGNSTVKITSDAAITGINGTTTFNNLQLVPTITAARTYTLQAGVGSPITINGDFTVNATKATTAARLTVNMGSSITGANTSTITVKGTTVGQATLTTTTGNYAITTGFIVIDDRGTLTANGSTITLNGTSGTLLTRTGTTVGVFVRGTSTVVVTSDASVTITSGTFGPSANSFNNLTFSPTITADRTYTLNSAAMTIAGDFTINPTAASAKALTVNLGGDLTVSTSKTITISGTTSGTSVLNTTSSNYAITTGLINIASAGTLTANGSTISLGATSGTLFTRSGTFNANTSTVKFTGDGSPTLTSGTVTFYNLQLVPASSGLVTTERTYTFGSGAVTVNNTFDLNPAGVEAAASMYLKVVLGAALSVNATSTLTNTPDGTWNATSTLDTTSSNYAFTTGSLVMSHASSTLVGNASTITINNHFWKTAGTFTPNTSTVTFTTATSSTINLGGTGTGNQFYNLTINKSSTATTTLITNNADITNALTISAGILDLGGKNIVTTTSFSNSGTLRLQGSETVSFSTNDTDSGTWEYYGDGTGAATTQTIKDFGNADYYALRIKDDSASNKDTFRTNGTLNASSTLTVAGGTMDISTNSNLLILDGAMTLSGGTLTATNGTIDANSDVTISGGTLTAPSGNFNVAGNWTRYSGTFTHSNGTVTFDTSSTPSLETAADETFYNLIVSKSGGSLGLLVPVNVANDFTQTAGTFDTTDQSLIVTGNLVLQGGTLEAISGAVTVSGNLTISGGTLSAPASEVLTIYGSYNNSGGTFTANSGTVIFASTAGGKTLAGTMTGTSAFCSLNFNGSGGAWAFSNNASTTGNFTYTLGTVTAPSLLSVAGNWTRSGGTFTHNSGTVELTGTNQTISGATTFYNLKKVDSSNNSTDPILTFPSNATTTISGLVTFTGLDSNDRVDLRASTWGTKWGFTVDGTYNINYASTTDSDASLGALITPNNTNDGGNNLNWNFNSLTIVVDGNTQDFGSLTPGTGLVATSSILTMKTSNYSGFVVQLQRSNSTATMRLVADTNIAIPDKTAWVPHAATTSAGNATASTTEPLTLQFRVRSSGTDTPNYASAWWGSDDTTANALFAGFPSTAQTIVNRSTPATATTTVRVLYNLAVPSTQANGAYSGDIIYTATVNP